MVNVIPELKEDHEGVCKGCALGKNVKKPFGSSASKSKEIIDFALMSLVLCLQSLLEVIYIM